MEKKKISADWSIHSKLDESFPRIWTKLQNIHNLLGFLILPWILGKQNSTDSRQHVGVVSTRHILGFPFWIGFFGSSEINLGESSQSVSKMIFWRCWQTFNHSLLSTKQRLFDPRRTMFEVFRYYLLASCFPRCIWCLRTYLTMKIILAIGVWQCFYETSCWN